MKAVTVNNIVLQFDLEDSIKPTEEVVQSQLEVINVLLSRQFPFSQPQLILSEDHEIIVVDPCNLDED